MAKNFRMKWMAFWLSFAVTLGLFIWHWDGFLDAMQGYLQVIGWLFTQLAFYLVFIPLINTIKKLFGK